MKQNSLLISNLISTVCILIIDLTQFLEYLETGNLGGWLSTVCFILANICMVIAWFSFFFSKKAAN